MWSQLEDHLKQSEHIGNVTWEAEQEDRKKALERRFNVQVPPRPSGRRINGRKLRLRSLSAPSGPAHLGHKLLGKPLPAPRPLTHQPRTHLDGRITP